MDPLPLEGIRVLDLGDVLAGPMAAMFLSDLGAEVILVESIQRIGQRGPVRPLPGTESYPNKEPGERPWDRNSRFDETARNKLSVTLDLMRPQGRKLFLRLVRLSDVFVSNYLPRQIEKMGATYSVLREARPDIIALYMPAYGISGPYQDYTGIGPAMEAISGSTSLRGYLGSDPTLNTVHWATDVSACITGSFAILAALHHRLQTGEGQVIDMSQIETMMPHLGEAILDYTMNGRIQGPMGNRHPSYAPQGVYRCRGENRWVAISVTSDAEWKALCHVLGGPPWCREERFSDPQSRWQNQDELDRRLEEWTAGQD
ncbi:MAG: CoA transferase, partial [Chloroflexota bacterium]|nr:CoA transferase [Chloroflexota bacterium]